ncbi:MAG: copper resistance protein NlpE N-terminal domain-containing protein [Termitinemataceae bacterium]|nr:MAG: copper resistance protein NlpE N-terminal domain-containing protein [Termitinemataceae bacterium]
MKKMFLVLAAFSLLGFGSCKAKEEAKSVVIDAAHNSRNSLDWAGVYRGELPSASGSGINVEITLNNDGTYSISYQYIDRGDELFTENGTFQWNDAGGAIKLDTNDMPPHYQVGEDTLIQLDLSGEKITGPLADSYVLKKVMIIE